MQVKDSPGVNMTSISYRDGKLAVCLAPESKVRVLDAETGDVEADLTPALRGTWE